MTRRKAYERKHFKMSDAEFTELKKLRADPKTFQFELLNFWEKLGIRYRFESDTVGPWDGMDSQHFTAVSNE